MDWNKIKRDFSTAGNLLLDSAKELTKFVVKPKPKISNKKAKFIQTEINNNPGMSEGELRKLFEQVFNNTEDKNDNIKSEILSEYESLLDIVDNCTFLGDRKEEIRKSLNTYYGTLLDELCVASYSRKELILESIHDAKIDFENIKTHINDLSDSLMHGL